MIAELITFGLIILVLACIGCLIGIYVGIKEINKTLIRLEYYWIQENVKRRNE